MIATFRRALIPQTWGERFFGALVAVCLVTLVWQASDRSRPSEVLSREVVTGEVRAGGVVKVAIKQRQHFEAEVSVYRTLYDGANLRYEYGVETFPPRQLQPEFTLQIPISPAALPGRARIQSTTCWERPHNLIHKLWPVCVTLKPVEFTIVP